MSTTWKIRFDEQHTEVIESGPRAYHFFTQSPSIVAEQREQYGEAVLDFHETSPFFDYLDFTSQDVADLLEVDPSTLFRWKKDDRKLSKAITKNLLEMDQIIAGVVINIVAAGLTSFFYAPGKTLPQLVPVVSIPILSDIPLIGPVFFRNGILALATLFIVLAVNFAIFKTRWGLRSRSVGEYPSAADAAGINVTRVRMMNVTLAGALAGCAGAFLALEAAGTFARGLTAGRGFLALAIMIFGAWNPMGALAAALFFGLSTALASQLQADEVINIPQQFVNLLPFVMTLIVLSVAVGRVRPPAAAGQPYTKEG